MGGFVITQLYGLTRSTVDLDALLIVPGDQQERLREKGIKGTALHRKHGVYLDVVAVASAPYDYDERLTEMFPGAYSNLGLLALDPYDLALTKLSAILSATVRMSGTSVDQSRSTLPCCAVDIMQSFDPI
jgi:hypothetical protein